MSPDPDYDFIENSDPFPDTEFRIQVLSNKNCSIG
jgi:hypothetical protein